jgi:muramoyltetrapeptide carboxypeptidase
MAVAAEFQNPFPPEIRTVAIVAPAGIPDPDRLEQGRDRLRAWGLELVDCTSGLQPRRFFAAADEARLAALSAAIANPAVDAIIAARGGYGTARLLPRLNLDRLRRRNIPIIGYSDCTALHLAAFAAGCKRQIFGPMVTGDFARQPADEHERKQLAGVFHSLGAALAPTPGEAVAAGPLTSLKSGRASGPLLPANLAVLTSLLGTPFMPRPTGCILVLEDINEAAYRIDRMLNQLAQAGFLDGLAGLVFGSFLDCEDACRLPEVLQDYADLISGPVALNLPFGHGFPSISLPVGALALLDTATCPGRFEWAVGDR